MNQPIRNIESLYTMTPGRWYTMTDHTYVMRVPGGWLFSMIEDREKRSPKGVPAISTSRTSCFVPFSEEFMPQEAAMANANGKWGYKEG